MGCNMFNRVLLAVILFVSAGAEECKKPEPARVQCPARAPQPSTTAECSKPCPKPDPMPCKKPCPKVCEPCKPCCNPPPACRWEFNPCNPKGCRDMKCLGYFIAADFLYWTSQNQGFSYAYELQNSSENVGKIRHIDPSWDPAYRFGIGWNTQYDFWDVFANYTWYRNKSSESRSSSIGFYRLFPQSDVTSLVPEYHHVSASSVFSMNMGDLEFGRLIYFTKSIAIRPHAGAEGGTLHQLFHTHFTDRVSGATDAAFKFKGRNNYWGVGPRAGANGEWHLSHGFSVTAKMAAALLYGKTKARGYSDFVAEPGESYAIDRHIGNHFFQLVPHLQMSAGFMWQTCFWCEKMFFKTSASWETNYWWNQFNLPVGSAGFITPLPSVGNQPLTTEGVTVNFEFDY